MPINGNIFYATCKKDFYTVWDDHGFTLRKGREYRCKIKSSVLVEVTTHKDGCYSFAIDNRKPFYLHKFQDYFYTHQELRNEKLKKLGNI